MKPQPKGIAQQSVYEQGRTHWDRLAGSGFPTLAAMAKHFTRSVDMAKELGVSDQSISNWKRGIRPTPQMEFKAQGWVLQQQRVTGPKQPDLPLFDQGGTQAPQQAHETVLVVRAPKDVVDGLMRVLGAMRCTVEATA